MGTPGRAREGAVSPAMCRGQTQVDAGGVCGKILNVIAKSSLSVSLDSSRAAPWLGVRSHPRDAALSDS